jgi:hypothetical protein
MRDPVENKDVILGFGYAGDRTNDDVARAYAGALSTVKSIRDSMRVLSLTREVHELQDTFGCCWARPRMWEQYSDVHRGACLLFEGDRLRLACHAQMPARTSRIEPTLFMASVDYTPRGIADSDLWGITARRPSMQPAFARRSPVTSTRTTETSIYSRAMTARPSTSTASSYAAMTPTSSRSSSTATPSWESFSASGSPRSKWQARKRSATPLASPVGASTGGKGVRAPLAG